MEEKRALALLSISRDPHRLIKTNPIINARFDITAVQMKVFLKIIASIDQSQDDIPEITIPISELKDIVGKSSKNIYSYLQGELSKLRKKEIHYEDEYIKLESNFINTIIYHKKDAVFTFDIPTKIKPFLLQIKENFTVLDIRNIMYLDSIYAIRFYEFCKEYERFKMFEFEVDELKQIFGITDKYKNYYDFKLKVLNQARSELLKNSEIYFDYQEIKSGKKVVKLRFKIKKNSKNQTLELTPAIDKVVLLVKDYVPESVVKAWFEKYSTEQIERGVEYGLRKIKKGEVKEAAPYIQKMVSMPEFVDSEKATLQQNVEKAKAKKEKKELEHILGEEIDRLKKEVYEERLKIFMELVRHESIREKILAKMQDSFFNKSYNSQLSFTDNLKDKNLAGMLVGIAQSLYPDDFSSTHFMDNRIVELERRSI